MAGGRTISRSAVYLLASLLLVLSFLSGTRGSYMHLFDFKVKDTTVNSNRVEEVSHDSFPRSLHHLTIGRDGMLYASSFVTSEVYAAMLDDSGHHWRWFRVVSRGGGGVGLDGATGIAVDDDLRLYVASFATDQVFRYNSVTGEYLDLFINDEHHHLDCPEGLLLLPDRLLVASFLNDRILSYDLGGRFLVSTPPLSPPPLLPRPLRLCAPSFLLPFLFSLSPPPSSPPFSTSALCSLPPPRFSFSLSSFLRLPSSSPAPPPPLSRPCSHLPSLFLLSSTHFSISASASSHSY